MALNGSGRHRAGPVVIGFADALAAPEASSSILAAGFEVIAFARRGSHPSLRRDPRVRIVEITAPHDDAAAARRDLIATVHACDAAALMPLDDASLWLCDQVAADVPAPIVGPTGARASLALDKRLQVEAARRAGLGVLATTIVTTGEEIREQDGFPLVLRPAFATALHDGRLTRGSARVCADADELDAAARDLADDTPLLVQPWVAGTGEGLFGLAVAGEVSHWSAHRRLRMINPQGSGSSACVSIAAEPELVEAAARMMRDVGWEGLFMLEFLRDHDGTAWFVELNGRAWGSLALARRLGFEYPAWAVGAALGVAVPTAVIAPPGRPVVCRHLGREIVHLINVMRGPRSAALVEWPSRWGTIRAVARVRRGERWYNWSARHPAVFVDDTVRTVLEPLRRRRSR
jgi:predicted ATP-grasp superfamily ATP-dependent carboligase